jgi:hypothetical protein
MNLKKENSKNQDFNSTASTKKNMFISLNNFSVGKKIFDSDLPKKSNEKNEN